MVMYSPTPKTDVCWYAGPAIQIEVKLMSLAVCGLTDRQSYCRQPDFKPSQEHRLCDNSRMLHLSTSVKLRAHAHPSTSSAEIPQLASDVSSA